MRAPSHRNRIIAGTVVASLLFVGVAWGLLGRAMAELSRVGEQRRALVSLRGLAEVVQRAGGKGDGVRAAVAAWAPAHPGLSNFRVVSLDDISLEASTSPDDKGEKAPPRQLAPEEKPLFDRAGNLRTAVDTNRTENGALKQEVESESLPNGRLSLAAPVEEEGAVVSSVSLESPPVKPVAPALPVALAALLVPILLVAGLGFALGEKRVPLLVAALLVTAAAEFFYLHHSLSTLEQSRREMEVGVAAQMKQDAALATQLVTQLNLKQEPALTPAAWDADLFRRPLGLVTVTGEVSEARLSAELSESSRRISHGLLALAAVSLALVLLFGLGGAARFGTTLYENRQAYSYVMPAMLGMLVLVFFPFIYGIALSFTDSNIYNTSKALPDIWIGLKNYIDILSDFQIAKRGEDGSLVFNYLNFYWTLFFTVVWTVTNVTIGVSVGLVLALILNTKNLALRAVYRVLLILPWAMPNYITALIWKGMFHRQFGVVNQLLAMVGLSPISWFDRPLTSFLTALATNGWLSFPFMMVVSLGALQSIPGELYEAARVDGASRWQQFRAITLPSLKPALVPAIILSVVWTFNMFNIIYLVTQGEPASSTEILITQAYKFAFEKYRYGYAAAYSTVIFGILVVYGSIQNRLTRATEAA